MRDLPPPLPPHERTVGQLVGETIRAYGDHFWKALPLGLPLVIVDQACVHASVGAQVLIYWAAAPLLVGAYVWACSLVLEVPPNAQAVLVALLVYLPFPVLRATFVLPGVAWFGLAGLAVPAALVEHLGVGDALRRGFRLGRADAVHAIGSLSALVIVVGIGSITLNALLRTQGEASARVALALADVVLSPLLFLGGAMLYGDQAARVGLPRDGRPRRPALPGASETEVGPGAAREG